VTEMPGSSIFIRIRSTETILEWKIRSITNLNDSFNFDKLQVTVVTLASAYVNRLESAE
jgi:hypothetical protein